MKCISVRNSCLLLVCTIQMLTAASESTQSLSSSWLGGIASVWNSFFKIGSNESINESITDLSNILNIDQSTKKEFEQWVESEDETKKLHFLLWAYNVSYDPKDIRAKVNPTQKIDLDKLVDDGINPRMYIMEQFSLSSPLLNLYAYGSHKVISLDRKHLYRLLELSDENPLLLEEVKAEADSVSLIKKETILLSLMPH